MITVIAYEMKYDKSFVEQSTIDCIPFEMQYFEQYKRIYNECFYDMRKALEIEPYNFLIVNKKFQKKGIGKQLLLWGMEQIRKKNTAPITLHVAEWNQNALRLYKNVGFEVIRSEKIR